MNITKIQAVDFAVAIHNAIERTRPWFPYVMSCYVADRLDFEADNIAEQVDNIVDQLKRDYPTLSRA